MGHKNLLHINHKIIQMSQRLPRRTADFLGDHANQIRLRFLAAQAVRQQQHPRQVAVVEHEEGDKGVVGTAVGLAHGGGGGEHNQEIGDWGLTEEFGVVASSG
jgi:hypothetical protein